MGGGVGRGGRDVRVGGSRTEGGGEEEKGLGFRVQGERRAGKNRGEREKRARG